MPLDPSAGGAADGPVPATHTDGAVEDGGEVTRTDSVQDRAAQYQGLPDVQARMKYIFPAMAIGVRPALLSLPELGIA